VLTAPEFVVRRAALAEILPLRHAELRPGLPLETARFEGDDDARTVHWGAFLAPTGETVGCATLTPRPRDGEPAWQLRGMATRADLVRCGIGSAILAASLSALHAEHGPVLVWCNARVATLAFYASQGWEAVSDVFDIPTVGPHRVMLRR
jgi:predicted GNAT family N-acyltransferase